MGMDTVWRGVITTYPSGEELAMFDELGSYEAVEIVQKYCEADKYHIQEDLRRLPVDGSGNFKYGCKEGMINLNATKFQL